jgi:hypothetical protein
VCVISWLDSSFPSTPKFWSIRHAFCVDTFCVSFASLQFLYDCSESLLKESYFSSDHFVAKGEEDHRQCQSDHISRFELPYFLFFLSPHNSRQSIHLSLVNRDSSLLSVYAILTLLRFMKRLPNFWAKESQYENSHSFFPIHGRYFVVSVCGFFAEQVREKYIFQLYIVWC